MNERSAYRWFPWSIAGAMAVVVAVNLAFAYFAFSSSPGLVTQHPFDEGNGYNAVLEAGAREDALGWKGKVAFAAAGKEQGELSVVFADRDGQKLTGLAVTAHIERPVEPLGEIVLPLPASGDGRYAAHTELARAGQWEVRVIARRGGDLYEFSERIYVK